MIWSLIESPKMRTVNRNSSDRKLYQNLLERKFARRWRLLQLVLIYRLWEGLCSYNTARPLRLGNCLLILLPDGYYIARRSKSTPQRAEKVQQNEIILDFTIALLGGHKIAIARVPFPTALIKLKGKSSKNCLRKQGAHCYYHPV